MILGHLERQGYALPNHADGGLPSRAGEEAGSQGGPKGRFCASKSFATASLEKNVHALQILDQTFLSIPHNHDKVLLLDLCRLLIKTDAFSKELLDAIGTLSLNDYFALCQEFNQEKEVIRDAAQAAYHRTTFTQWRNAHFKEYLKERRLEEKRKKTFVRPYTDYLESAEKKMFSAFWETNQWHFYSAYFSGEELKQERAPRRRIQEFLQKLPSPLATAFLQTVRSFNDLDRSLYGTYRNLRQDGNQQLEKHLAAAFYPLHGLGYVRSQAYRQSTPQGSVFKLMSAYAALVQKYESLKRRVKNLEELNPLTVIDEQHLPARDGSQILGYTLSGETIYRNYKGGRLPRSHPNIGKIDLISALEQSSNLYFSLLAGDILHAPQDLVETAEQFGFGEKSGIDLPGEIAGNLPKDSAFNRTGLYALAIGQHALTVTPLQTALMLSALANGGELLKPQIVRAVVGREPLRQESPLYFPTRFPFKKELALVGVHFPIFTEANRPREKSLLVQPEKEVRRTLFLPEEIRSILFQGMKKVVTGSRGTSRLSLFREGGFLPSWIRDHTEIQSQIIAKTGTAEILYKGTLDAETPPSIKKHVWFACISFSPSLPEEPELVVVIYLRFSGAGRDAAPLATQIIKKWREIVSHYQNRQSF